MVDLLNQEKITCDVFIVGGGIAGLALAAYLEKHTDISYRILEKRAVEEIEQGGFGYTFMPIGRKALEEIDRGLLRSLDLIQVKDFFVRNLNKQAGEGILSHYKMPEEFCSLVERKDLISCLKSLIPVDKYIDRSDLLALSRRSVEGKDLFELQLAESVLQVEAKLLLGCDGSFSKVRDMINSPKTMVETFTWSIYGGPIGAEIPPRPV